MPFYVFAIDSYAQYNINYQSFMTKERISYVDLGAGIMILWMILGHAFSTAGWMEIASYDLWNVTDASLIPEGVHAVIGAEGKIKALGMGHFIPSFLFFFMPW